MTSGVPSVSVNFTSDAVSPPQFSPYRAFSDVTPEMYHRVRGKKVLNIEREWARYSVQCHLASTYPGWLIVAVIYRAIELANQRNYDHPSHLLSHRKSLLVPQIVADQLVCFLFYSCSIHCTCYPPYSAPQPTKRCGIHSSWALSRGRTFPCSLIRNTFLDSYQSRRVVCGLSNWRMLQKKLHPGSCTWILKLF